MRRSVTPSPPGPEGVAAVEVAESIVTNVVAPDARYEGAWDSILAPPEIKDRLLSWALLSLRLRSSLPFEATALHGLVVLHGPPGTGKTTLARGLAHQVSRYVPARRARFLEVSPHGLMSGEHGASQRRVGELLGEHLPSLAADGLPTVVLLDEVESVAVARSEASLAANPADVHRATDAVLTALDANTRDHPHLLFVATSNFTGALDEAFLSRADAAIAVPAPDAAAAAAILRATVQAMSAAFPPLAALTADPHFDRIGALLAGTDGRRIRKSVTEAMAAHFDTVREPGALTVAALEASARSITRSGGRQGARREAA